MKMNTCELRDASLDSAVAQCERVEPGRSSGKMYLPDHRVYLEDFIPSYSWAQGGPIIERERISTTDQHGCRDAGIWMASIHLPHDNGVVIEFGPTPLIAAMRCYVASKLGDVVDVPDELVA